MFSLDLHFSFLALNSEDAFRRPSSPVGGFDPLVCLSQLIQSSSVAVSHYLTP